MVPRSSARRAIRSFVIVLLGAVAIVAAVLLAVAAFFALNVWLFHIPLSNR